MAKQIDPVDARMRLQYLDGLFQVYEEDKELYGLVPEDEARLAAWHKEADALRAVLAAAEEQHG